MLYSKKAGTFVPAVCFSYFRWSNQSQRFRDCPSVNEYQWRVPSRNLPGDLQVPQVLVFAEIFRNSKPRFLLGLSQDSSCVSCSWPLCCPFVVSGDYLMISIYHTCSTNASHLAIFFSYISELFLTGWCLLDIGIEALSMPLSHVHKSTSLVPYIETSP